MVYAERYVGFYLSYLIPTICFTITLPVLAYCKKWYKLSKPEGSVLMPAVKLLMQIERRELSPHVRATAGST